MSEGADADSFGVVATRMIRDIQRLEGENERLHGVLEDVYAYLRTIDYRDDVFEQVAPLERVLREAVSK